MRKKFSYCEKYSEKVELYLNNHEIKYKTVGDGILVPKLISFAVYDGVASAPEFRQLIHGKPIVTNEFTQKELNAAGYLTMRPQKNIVNIANANEAFLYKCQRKSLFGVEKFSHKEQVGLIRVKKFNLKGTTYFFSPTTGFSEIFAKDSICDFIKDQNVTGMEVRPVLLDERNHEMESGLCQLWSKKTIPKNMIFLDEKQAIEKCPVCGSSKILCKQDFQLQLVGSISDLSDDFCMTEAIFGEGISYPLYIVSQRLFQLFVRTGMSRNVVFEPVLVRD